MGFSKDRYKYKIRGAKLNEIKNIKEIINQGQFQTAIRKINEFLKTYGDDIEILYLYGKLLRKTDNVEHAISVLKRAKDIINVTEDFSFANAINTELFKVYFINDYYKEAYNLLQECHNMQLYIRDYTNTHNLPSVDEFKRIVEVRLGIYQETGDESSIIKKVLYYDRDLALNHVKKHLVEIDYTYKQHSLFNDIDIEKLFKLTEENLKSAKKIQRFSFHDLYMFDFYRIGQDCSDKLQVVTNKGTNEIISMYPTTSNIKCFVNGNLYEQYFGSEPTKTKVLSRIDKFNKRYNLK